MRDRFNDHVATDDLANLARTVTAIVTNVCFTVNKFSKYYLIVCTNMFTNDVYELVFNLVDEFARNTSTLRVRTLRERTL